jgi:hypothetical protein
MNQEEKDYKTLQGRAKKIRQNNIAESNSRKHVLLLPWNLDHKIAYYEQKFCWKIIGCVVGKCMNVLNDCVCVGLVVETNESFLKDESKGISS